MQRSSIHRSLPRSRTSQGRKANSRPSASLAPFVIAALGIGAPFLALSTVITPDAPFLLAAVILGLALPALVITYREAGGAAVRALLRDCLRLPNSRWWLLVAGFGLPAMTWTTGAALGGAQPLTWGLVAFYVGDLLIGALVINVWEEMAWTGFFQRRAASRWGAVSGALVTSVFFTAIHVPLALAGADGVREIAGNLTVLTGVATGVRLLVARVDPWCGGSILTIGVLHSSFNASETLLDADHFWVRIAVTIAVGIGCVALGKKKTPAG
jgi:membrane protease YdiL (CAAX protease family)